MTSYRYNLRKCLLTVVVVWRIYCDQFIIWKSRITPNNQELDDIKQYQNTHAPALAYIHTKKRKTNGITRKNQTIYGNETKTKSKWQPRLRIIFALTTFVCGMSPNGYSSKRFAITMFALHIATCLHIVYMSMAQVIFSVCCILCPAHIYSLTEYLYNNSKVKA